MKNGYDNETLYAYLLGSLPEKDTDRLDEMTFTDEVFAEAVDGAENDLVDAYVAGDLSGDMRERFEAYYLASSAHKDKVAFARGLKEYADGHNSARAFAAPAAEQGKSIFDPVAALFNWKAGLSLAAAAAAVIVLGIGGFFILRTGQNGQEIAVIPSVNDNFNRDIVPVNSATPVRATPTPAENNGTEGNTKPLVNAASPTPSPSPKKVEEMPRTQIATIVLLPPVRGGEKLSTLTIKPNTGEARFTIKLDSADHSAYSVSLVDQSSGRQVWRSSSLRPSGSSLSVAVPAKLLDQHVYTFTVSGLKDGVSENIGDYAFRVVKEE